MNHKNRCDGVGDAGVLKIMNGLKDLPALKEIDISFFE